MLRHMERQDPQGEENGDHNLASYQYMNRLAGSDPSLFQVTKKLQCGSEYRACPIFRWLTCVLVLNAIQYLGQSSRGG